jgi:hypothetical protein
MASWTGRNEHLAVVGGENDDGVVLEAVVLEIVHHGANDVVELGHAGFLDGPAILRGCVCSHNAIEGVSTQDEPSSKKIADLIIAAAFIAISQKRGTILPLRGVAWNLKERLAASRFKRALPSGTKHETYAQIIAVWSGRAPTTSIAHAARTS